jgi:hypothetical protein
MVGELIAGNTAAPGSAISSGNPSPVASISLSAGDWDVRAVVGVDTAASSAVTLFEACINTSSNSIATAPNAGAYVELPVTLATNFRQGVFVGIKQVNISTTTTIYLVQNCSFSGSATAWGYIAGRRMR